MATQPQDRTLQLPLAATLGLGLLLLAGACSHTDAAEYLPYAPADPMAPGAEAQLALSGSGVEWVAGGSGIVYVGNRCLTRATTNGTLIPSMRMLPASGGSATWELCEGLNSYRRQADSLESFGTVAMDARGKLLYTVCTWPNIIDLNCSNSGHVQLWLGDSSWAYTRRHRLADLYNILGVPPDPRAKLNNLSEIQWAGASGFVARGFNSNPTTGDSILGLVVGQIDSTGAAMTLLPNTANVLHWSVARQGSAIIAARSGFAIETISPLSGVADTVALIVAPPGSSIVAISCRGTICLIAANQGQSGATFWQLGLISRQLVQLGGVPGAVSSAVLSAVSDAVVLGRSTGYSLLAHVGLKPEIQ